MADPVAIIGTAGALTNVIDVLGKCISTINETHQQWKDADFTPIKLKSHLSALRATLSKIQETIDTDMVLHYQLVMDLDISLTCCRLLLSRIDAQTATLKGRNDGSLDVSSRIKFISGPSKIEDLQKMIDRQTSALKILLTACSCMSMYEQTMLLEKRSTRRTIGGVQKDSASLVILRDSSTFFSRYSDGLSKVSGDCSFDKDSFVSRVYERALRGPMRDSLRKQSNGTSSSFSHARTGSKDSLSRSLAIDRQLEEESRQLRSGLRILVSGRNGSAKTEFVEHLKLTCCNEDPARRTSQYRSVILANIVNSVRALAAATKTFDIEPEVASNCEYRDFLMHFEPDLSGQAYPLLGEPFAIALAGFWSDPCIPELMQHSHEIEMMDAAAYFFHESARITAPDYIPSNLDILRARWRQPAIDEFRMQMGQLTLRFCNVGGRNMVTKKWIHQFENITAIIFVVDLAEYDQSVSEEDNTNSMIASLMLFKAMFDNSWFAKTSVILLLNNVSSFRSKLMSSPLAHQFPDYQGGPDFYRASKYILRRFNQLNHARLTIYPYLIDSKESPSIGVICSAIKETILHTGLLDMNTLDKETILQRAVRISNILEE